MVMVAQRPFGVFDLFIVSQERDERESEKLRSRGAVRTLQVDHTPLH